MYVLNLFLSLKFFSSNEMKNYSSMKQNFALFFYYPFDNSYLYMDT